VSSFENSIRERAALVRPRIAFPESADPRTLAAVTEIAALGIAEPVLILDPAHPATHSAAVATGLETLDPSKDSRAIQIGELLHARRSGRGLSAPDANHLALDPLFFADGLVALEQLAGCVAGAVHTTADVLRAAIWTVGPAPSVRSISSAFYMVVTDFRGNGEEVLTFSDCAVIPQPDATQLADIAIAAASDRARIVGDEPVVAFLSYSTAGSADGPSVAMVREACALVRERRPELILDGELQVDAALIASIGARKAPLSRAAGRANILVFPSLDAGNIGYKLVERLGHARAYGPIVQGLAHPCSDLSRGARTDDIINVASITALQTVGRVGPGLNRNAGRDES
jgi:phosphate acetyltransferase